MAKTCNVESCERFSTTQWVIGVAITIMVALQGYLISRIDKIENLVMGYQVSTQSIKDTLASHEDTFRFLLARIGE